MATLVSGLRAADVDAVAEQLAALVPLAFVKRNSLYFGDYCLHQEGERTVKVQFNLDPDGDYFESERPECGVLIYVSLPLSEQAQFEVLLRKQFSDAVVMPPRKLG